MIFNITKKVNEKHGVITYKANLIVGAEYQIVETNHLNKTVDIKFIVHDNLMNS